MCLLFPFFVFLDVPFRTSDILSTMRSKYVSHHISCMRCLMKENPVLNFSINTISYVVNFINFEYNINISHTKTTGLWNNFNNLNVNKTLVWPHVIFVFVHTAVLRIKTAFNLVKIHLLFRIMLLIQCSLIISIFVVHVFIVFGRLKYISCMFSEYMLTFMVEEPMKICVTN